jgi:hypothetical protein
VAGSCEYGNDPSGSGATELVIIRYSIADLNNIRSVDYVRPAQGFPVVARG